MVIVGPSGSGKSTVWRLLKAGLVKRGQSVIDYIMNPKAMPRTQVWRDVHIIISLNHHLGSEWPTVSYS